MRPELHLNGDTGIGIQGLNKKWTFFWETSVSGKNDAFKKITGHSHAKKNYAQILTQWP